MLGKVVYANQIWNKDYIYLDWNVIKYLKEPRPDKEKLDRDVYEIVMKLNKKYVFPFSEAHIEDRCNNFKEEYLPLIQDDLQFVGRLSNDYCVAQSEDGEELKAIKYDVIRTRINDRILEMCKPIHMGGESKRTDSGKQKMSKLKEVFNKGGNENE